MLASSSTFLITAAPPSPGAASGDAVAGGEAAPGFAALLDRLSAQAAGALPSGTPSPGAANAAAATASASGLAIAAGLHRPATVDQAATDGGKDLPDDLPEPAEAADPSDTGVEGSNGAALAANPFALLALAGLLPLAPGSTNAVPGDRPLASASRRTKGPATPPSAAAARDLSGKPKPDAPKPEGRQVPAVAISAAPHGTQASGADAPGASEPRAPLKGRAALMAELLRGEAPAAQPAASVPAMADAKQPAPAAGPPAPGAPAPTPSSVDIDAALDQLVAAREALMPAEAALAIDHAEFGEVSIRFEQSADGQLSAELAAADPELHRAVNAAVSAERGSASGSEGEAGRPGHLAGQRATTGGSDAAAGERGQSGTDRDLPQRRGATRSEPRQAPSDPSPGIFA